MQHLLTCCTLITSSL